MQVNSESYSEKGKAPDRYYPGLPYFKRPVLIVNLRVLEFNSVLVLISLQVINVQYRVVAWRSKQVLTNFQVLT